MPSWNADRYLKFAGGAMLPHGPVADRISRSPGQLEVVGCGFESYLGSQFLSPQRFPRSLLTAALCTQVPNWPTFRSFPVSPCNPQFFLAELNEWDGQGHGFI